MRATGNNAQDQLVLDSIGYPKKHRSIQSLQLAAESLLEALQKKGYLEASFTSATKKTDSLQLFVYDLKTSTKSIHIQVKGFASLFSNCNYLNIGDSIKIPYSQAAAFLECGLKKLESNGESLAKLQLTQLRKQQNYIVAQLEYLPEKSRTLNTLVIKGYENFPSGYLKSLSKLYQKTPFNQALVKQLKKEFDSYPFCTQIKAPEVQFTKDSTSLYIYVQKRNANSFDGFLGFSNNESSNINLSGYVDVQLQNMLNNGESIAVTWKSDGKQQKTFAGQVDLPYVFNTPLALKAQLQIFKQDSTFQNTKTALHLGYLFRFHKRIYLGYQSAESSDTQNLNSAALSDYKNHFTTLSYEYFDNSTEDPLFPEKTKWSGQYGFGSRNTPSQKNKQYFIALNLKNDWALNDKNHLLIKNELYYLHSDRYLLNELGRFGGINSIIGFNENSLQANFLATARSEYRYKISPSLYWSALFDYGLYQDRTTNPRTNSISGIGTGIKLATKTGLLNLVYAASNTSNQSFNYKNAIVHLSLKSYF